jgi:hypothetical protein
MSILRISPNQNKSDPMYTICEREFELIRSDYFGRTGIAGRMSGLSALLNRSSEYLRKLVARFRGDLDYLPTRLYSSYRYSPDTDIYLFSGDIELADKGMAFIKRSIDLYAGFLIRIKAFLEQCDLERVEPAYHIHFPQGTMPHDHEYYLLRTIDDYLKLKADHVSYMSLYNIALVKSKSVDNTQVRSRYERRGFRTEDCSPVAAASMLSSNVMRRALEFVLPANKLGGK